MDKVSDERLSQVMRNCVEDMAKWGSIARFPGGFWNAPQNAISYRTASYGTSTVEALISRGIAEYSEWQEGRNGRFPIAAKLTGARRT